MHSRQYPLRHATLAISDSIAEFTHQRPEARNALSLELRQDYADMLDIVETERDVRALILTGSGGSFCAGGDLRSIRDLLEDPDPTVREPAAMRRRLTEIHGWLRRLHDLELPVIAAVDAPPPVQASLSRWWRISCWRPSARRSRWPSSRSDWCQTWARCTRCRARWAWDWRRS